MWPDVSVPHTQQINCRGYWRSEANVVNATQLPLLLLEHVIRRYSKDGHVISLCTGSGSDLIAAARLGKNSVGIDNNMFQISQAAMRLKTFSQQEKAALATSPVDHSKIVVTLEGNSQEAYERGEAHEEHEEVQEEEASQVSHCVSPCVSMHLRLVSKS
ncbi:TPA: hypothetical protein ACH3X2_006753 [Trebouxia sp. C0005]